MSFDTNAKPTEKPKASKPWDGIKQKAKEALSIVQETLSKSAEKATSKPQAQRGEVSQVTMDRKDCGEEPASFDDLHDISSKCEKMMKNKGIAPNFDKNGNHLYELSVKFVELTGYEVLNILYEFSDQRIVPDEVICERCDFFLLPERTNDADTALGKHVKNLQFVGINMETTILEKTLNSMGITDFTDKKITRDKRTMKGIRTILSRLFEQFPNLLHFSYDDTLIPVVSMNNIFNEEEKEIDLKKVLNEESVGLLLLIDEIFRNFGGTLLRSVNDIDIRAVLDLCDFSSKMFFFPKKENLNWNDRQILEKTIPRSDKLYDKCINSEIWKSERIINEIKNIKAKYHEKENILSLFIDLNESVTRLLDDDNRIGLIGIFNRVLDVLLHKDTLTSLVLYNRDEYDSGIINENEIMATLNELFPLQDNIKSRLTVPYRLKSEAPNIPETSYQYGCDINYSMKDNNSDNNKQNDKMDDNTNSKENNKQNNKEDEKENKKENDNPKLETKCRITLADDIIGTLVDYGINKKCVYPFPFEYWVWAIVHEIRSHVKLRLQAKYRKTSFFAIGQESGHHGDDNERGGTFITASGRFMASNLHKNIVFETITKKDISLLLSYDAQNDFENEKTSIMKKMIMESCKKVTVYWVNQDEYQRRYPQDGPLPQSLYLLIPDMVFVIKLKIPKNAQGSNIWLNRRLGSIEAHGEMYPSPQRCWPDPQRAKEMLAWDQYS